MKRIFFTIVLIIFMTVGVFPVWGSRSPIVEPEIYTGTGWDVTSPGMLVVGYDLDHNGLADYFTLRTIISAFFSDESVQSIAKNSPGKPVFYVNYDKDRFVYIAGSKPLFYAFDVDEDGQWDLIFRDFLEDGVNGNEEFYDSPSGKFIR